MADVAPTDPTPLSSARVGVSLDLTGDECVGAVNGDWITPLNGVNIVGVAVAYNEDSGTAMTQAVITYQVKLPGDSTAYTVFATGLAAALTHTFTADASTYCPLAPAGPTAGAVVGGLRGIDAIRAVATISGTGAGTDAVKVTFVGVKEDWR